MSNAQNKRHLDKNFQTAYWMILALALGIYQSLWVTSVSNWEFCQDVETLYLNLELRVNKLFCI